MRFASLYNGQEVFVWSNCLLDLFLWYFPLNGEVHPEPVKTLRVHVFCCTNVNTYGRSACTPVAMTLYTSFRTTSGLLCSVVCQ